MLNRVVCPKCGYENSVHRATCKKCHSLLENVHRLSRNIFVPLRFSILLRSIIIGIGCVILFGAISIYVIGDPLGHPTGEGFVFVHAPLTIVLVCIAGILWAGLPNRRLVLVGMIAGFIMGIPAFIAGAGPHGRSNYVFNNDNLALVLIAYFSPGLEIILGGLVFWLVGSSINKFLVRKELR